MITPVERAEEYQARIEKLKTKTMKLLESGRFEEAVSKIMEAKALREAYCTIYLLKGEGWIKDESQMQGVKNK